MSLQNLKSWLRKARQVDLVWDDYLDESLKAGSWERRGQGQQRRIIRSAPMPTNWKKFLHLDENKNELCSFQSTQSANLETGETELVVMLREGVVGYP